MQSLDQSGGQPDSLGRVKPASECYSTLTLLNLVELADTDPMGIDKQISFESVGGLEDRNNH